MHGATSAAVNEFDFGIQVEKPLIGLDQLVAGEFNRHHNTVQLVVGKITKHDRAIDVLD